MSEQTSTPANSPTPALSPRRGIARFLFKTRLGIALLVLGSLALGAALAPRIAQRFAGKYASDWFAERYRGQLTVGKLELGWIGPQTIEGLELKDQGGARVALFSATLPGLWALATSGGTKLGKLKLVGEASLYADPTGRTNLESALEPREQAKESAKNPVESDSPSSLAKLDVELDVTVTRIYWADEHTREIGAPFVIENLSLAVVAHPEKPLSAHMRGTLTGSVRSDLSFDASIEHPFEAPSSRTPPKAEISAQIAHLPTALLDALTRQGGRLKALLGEQLSLQLDAKGTLQQGSFDLRVDFPHGKVHGSARIADGVLRSEGEGVAAEFDMQQDFVESVTHPLLSGGTKLVHIGPGADQSPLGPNGERIGFALSSFEAPIGAYLEASAKGEAQAGLDALLAGVRARWTANLGDWLFDGSSALANRGGVTVRDLKLNGELKAPTEESNLEFSFRASNPSKHYAQAQLLSAEAQADMAFGKARVSLTFPGGATLAHFAPSAALAPVHATVHMEDVPTALFDSIAGLNGDLTRALGGKLALEFDATTSIEAAAKQDLSWMDLATRWRELAGRIRSDATFNLRGSPRGEALKALGDQILAVHTLGASAKLAPQAPVDLHAQLEFETPAGGHFDFTLSLGELFADPASKTPLRFSLASNASGLPAKAADFLAGSGERIQQLLGNLLAFEVTAQGTLEQGVARVNVSSEKSQVLLVGRLQKGMFVNMDEPALSISLQPDARLLDELAATYLPKGSRLAFAESRGIVGMNVNFLALPVAELIESAKKSSGAALSTALTKTRIDALIGLREFEYEDEALLAAGQRIDKLALQLNLELRPGDKSTPLALDLSLVSPSLGAKAVDLHVDVPHAPDLLKIQEGLAFAPIVMRLHAAELKTALLDSYAGGVLHEALGPALDLSLETQISQVDGANFAADTKLELSAAGGKSTLVFKAQAKDPFNKQAKEPAKPRPEGAFPELEASLDVSGASALLAFAPQGARSLLRELCGETIAARVKLAQGEPGASQAEISLDAGGLTLSGAIDYREETLSSKDARPLVLRVAATQATLERLLAGKLPAGASLKLSQPGAALVVQLNQLHLPLGRFKDADPSLARADLIEHLDLQLDATLPPLNYSHPPGEKDVTAAIVALRDVQLRVRMQPSAPATFDLSGKIDATPPGGLDIHAVIEKPAGFAVEPQATFPAPGSRATLTAKLSHFPSALLDVLAQQDGLLVDVLGPELEANVSGQYPDAGAPPLHAELHSSFGDLLLNARIVDGVLVSEADQGLDAKIGLTPLFSKRVIGSLVPMILQVRQDDPTKRTLLSGRKLSLPMNADMSKFSGEMLLDLGAVDYQLLPGLSQALSLVGAKDPGAKNTVIKPIAIKVMNGIARYDSIPIKISGREVNFHGSANLAQKSFELAFTVPLEMLGAKVESQLEAVRSVLDPKLEVPLEIYGSWSSPKLRLGKGFLEKVLEDAAKGELEKGLGDLFGGKQKKKKGG